MFIAPLCYHKRVRVAQVPAGRERPRSQKEARVFFCRIDDQEEPTVPKIKCSFSFRCILFCIIIFIIPTLSSVLLLYRDAKKESAERTLAFLSTSLINAAGNYDEVLRNANLYHLQPLNNRSFLEYNSTLFDVSKRHSYDWVDSQTRINEMINTYLMTNREIDSIYLYNTGANLFLSCSYYSKSRRIDYTDLPDEQIRSVLRYVDGAGEKNKRFTIRQELEGDKTVLASSSRVNMFYAMDPPVYFTINLDFDRLAERLVSALPIDGVRVWVTDSAGNGMQVRCGGEAAKTVLSSDTAVPDPARDEIECVYTAPYSGLTYRARAPLGPLDSTPALIERFAGYLLLTMLVILMVILLTVSIYIIRPIRKVYTAMGRVESGDLRLRLSVTRNDEIGCIQAGFNRMLAGIENLIAENYEFLLAQKEMELKYIHTQINEHFLYNTLDSIHWIAKKHRVPEISRIIFRLSDFYRMTLSEGDELVPIAKVIRIMESYVELCSIRLDRPAALTYRVEPGLENDYVLKYIFQPLLENAIVHGVRQAQRDGAVQVSFSRTPQDEIFFEMRDNGCGIRSDVLDSLRASLRDPQTDCREFFALRNIQSQLRLCYGVRCAQSLTIDSTYGDGTVIAITIPRKKENGRVQKIQSSHH